MGQLPHLIFYCKLSRVLQTFAKDLAKHLRKSSKSFIFFPNWCNYIFITVIFEFKIGFQCFSRNQHLRFYQIFEIFWIFEPPIVRQTISIGLCLRRSIRHPILDICRPDHFNYVENRCQNVNNGSILNVNIYKLKNMETLFQK